MSDREKLIELLGHLEYQYIETHSIMRENVVDYLIAHGVTVGKPLTEYLHPIDNYEGLKGKYIVFKANTGERVLDCFVLRPAKDSAAVNALRAYADTTDNKTLAADIYNWVDEAPTIDAVPVVHGRWEPVEDGETGCDEWDCTACGQRRTFLCEMDADDMKECYPYCPNCGAKMEAAE